MNLQFGPGTSRSRATARGVRNLVLVLLALLAAIAFVPKLFRSGPSMVRELWSFVGVRRVEGHAAEIRAAAAESGVDPCLLAAIMYAESRGKVDAVSSRGALGPFQLMPSAAGDAAKRLLLPEPSRELLLSDALLGARLAGAHLGWLLRFEGPDLERVLVAYNAGRTKLRRWTDAAGGWEAWRIARDRAPERDGAGGALAYARSVLAMQQRFRERGAIAPPPAPIGGAGGDVGTGIPQ